MKGDSTGWQWPEVPLPSVAALLAAAQGYEQVTRSRFVELYVDDRVTYPIPFFGDIATARVLTVGVNPSATEFCCDRWPRNLSLPAQEARLTTYFAPSAPVPPHKWFTKWMAPLAVLGVAHGHGAAHLDLSPRATRSMGACQVESFLEMIAEDVAVFFQTLSLCRSARLLVLAGTVTHHHYLHRYLRRVAPAHGAQVSVTQETTGPAPVAIGRLTWPHGSLPFFFCGVSPSARQNSAALLGRLTDYRSQLDDFLNA